MRKFSSGTEFLIIFRPLGNCMIFKIKYNVVILELIVQLYFDLKRNKSKHVWNKCLINCFRIDSLSSNMKDNTTHLSMQHCFHVVFSTIGTQYLHVRHLTIIFQIIIKCDAHAQNSKSLLLTFLLCFNQCYSNKLWKHEKRNTKYNFW